MSELKIPMAWKEFLDKFHVEQHTLVRVGLIRNWQLTQDWYWKGAIRFLTDVVRLSTDEPVLAAARTEMAIHVCPGMIHLLTNFQVCKKMGMEERILIANEVVNFYGEENNVPADFRERDKVHRFLFVYQETVKEEKPSNLLYAMEANVVTGHIEAIKNHTYPGYIEMLFNILLRRLIDRTAGPKDRRVARIDGERFPELCLTWQEWGKLYGLFCDMRLKEFSSAIPRDTVSFDPAEISRDLNIIILLCGLVRGKLGEENDKLINALLELTSIFTVAVRRITGLCL